MTTMISLLRALLCLAILGSAQVANAQPRRTNAFPLKDRNHIETSIKQFMDSYSVPGLSIAITKNGQLILARGFGFADVEKREPVTTDHRFRIASLSKPITSVAIHTLIQQRKLSYEDRVFGDDSVLGHGDWDEFVTDDHRKITVEHLLTHTAGGWDNKNRDPMFMRRDLDHPALIRWTLENQPLDSAPGTQYAYSNFGYCLLGRIIERVTGQDYEEYIVNNIVGTAGARSFEIAGNRLADRRRLEVKYYADGGDPYTHNISRMDAHGGWIATATDLLRFMVFFDGFPNPNDRLSRTAIKRMVTPSARNPNYAKGWSVNQYNNWWHTGSLPGTGTILVRASNGYCWAVLTNTRSSKEGYMAALDKLPWTIVNGLSGR